MLNDFPITKKWPAKDPSVIQLYSLPTPNGIKVSAMLEGLRHAGRNRPAL